MLVDTDISTPTHLVNVAQPFGDEIEALRMRYVVHEHNALGATVTAGRECVEAFLAGRVPATAVDAHLPLPTPYVPYL